jgi:hypothetical protein
MTDQLDDRLLEWATPTQARYLEAVNLHQSCRRAADALSVHHATVSRSLKALKAKAASQGYSPDHDMNHPAPPGFRVKGASTYYNSEGKLVGQWVKTTQDTDQTEALVRNFVEALAEDMRGRSRYVPAPEIALADLLCVYPMGDPHFGLYAWAEESGEDFDLDTAERLTCGAIDRLVASAPPAETAIVLNLGDFFHGDTVDNQTRSGHALDIDSRWAKVMQVGLRAMVYVIERTLSKHQKVIVRNVRGNHDTHASFALALALDCHFANNDRVSVDLSPATYWYYRFGKVLLGASHGDTCKMASLPGIMACDRPEEWGATRFRAFYLGHIHHEKVQEFPGCTVEYFRTLAAKDAWHAGQGYRSGRDMRCVVFHSQFGEIERHRCDVSMLAAAA